MMFVDLLGFAGENREVDIIAVIGRIVVRKTILDSRSPHSQGQALRE